MPDNPFDTFSYKWSTMHPNAYMRRYQSEVGDFMRKMMTTMQEDKAKAYQGTRDLFGYQKDGVAFLKKHHHAFLADQPGLGKTAQAITAARELAIDVNNADRGTYCVFCPKSAIQNWRREWNIWWPTFKGHLHVLNYDILPFPDNSQCKMFLETQFDLVIADEGHRLKSPEAKRTQAFYRGLTKRALRVWILSGTPARNHAGEMWTHLVSLRPDLIRDRSGRPMTQDQFEERYCDVYFDNAGRKKVRGSKNIGELRKLMTDGGFLLRRLKKDVHDQLPELIFDEYFLSPDPVEVQNISQIMGGGNLSGKTFDEIYEIMKDSAVNLSSERRAAGILKAKAVGDFVENELDAPGKIIVFYHHQDVGDALEGQIAAAGFKTARVDGNTRDAQAQVDLFQSDPDVRVFLGQITACGEALNITAANQVVFAEASWSPADNYQAACRAHRIGMGDSLLVRFLSVPNTVDAIIQRVLARKTSELADLFD